MIWYESVVYSKSALSARVWTVERTNAREFPHTETVVTVLLLPHTLHPKKCSKQPPPTVFHCAAFCADVKKARGQLVHLDVRPYQT